MGHSFGCQHQGNGIMNAVVSPNATWNATSKAVINSLVNNSGNCNVGDKALLGSPKALFLLAETACINEPMILFHGIGHFLKALL